MLRRTKPSHMPMRLATGGYILNAGVDLIDAGAHGAEEIHGTTAPRMHRPQGIRPTDEALSLAEDAWMMGIALTLLSDRGSRRRRSRRG